ncbi:MAG: hypothetical protein M3347_13275, partial [Armatimonadota bacterium]|nr:hypothetical protein [Armatimonadota bacterium]
MRRYWRATLLLLAGLWSGVSSSPAQTTASVPLLPYRDPWPAARERWWDLADNPLHAFLNGEQSFSYSNSGMSGVSATPQVVLTYNTAPPAPYFMGHIDAEGLKPNFSYQLKLIGKPVKGTWGWGAEGDDVTNERLGYAARWFCGHPIHA